MLQCEAPPAKPALGGLARTSPPVPARPGPCSPLPSSQEHRGIGRLNARKAAESRYSRTAAPHHTACC